MAFALAAGLAGPAAAQGPGYLHEWTFNGHMRDLVGTSHGSPHGGAGMVRGRLVLDGRDDYVSVAPHASLSFTKAYTVLAWVRSTGPTTSYRVILIRGAGSANDIEIYIQSRTNHLIVFHNRTNKGTPDFVGFAPPPANQWFFLAVTFDGAMVRAYYDGVPQPAVQRNRAMAPPIYTGKPLEIGRTLHYAFGRNSHFRGEIDEVRIHDQALSAFWIKVLHHIGPAMAGVFLEFGRACGGTRAPALSVPASVCPTIGQSFKIALRSKAANAPAVLITGASKSTWRYGALPLDIGSLAPGCKLYTSVDVLTVLRTDNLGSATHTVHVPSDPGLVGVEFHNQGVVVDLAANAFGLVFSNAGTVRVGWP